LLPKVLRDQRDIRAFLLLGQKVSTDDGPNSQHIEVVRGQSAPKNLDGIAQPSEGESEEIFAGETFTNCLSISKMFETRGGKRQVYQIARFITAVKVNDARRFLERKAAQKKIVDQTEDRGVETDPKSESDYGDQGEGRRLSKFTKCEPNIVHVRMWV